jgi:hypothetical protein
MGRRGQSHETVAPWRHLSVSVPGWVDHGKHGSSAEVLLSFLCSAGMLSPALVRLPQASTGLGYQWQQKLSLGMQGPSPHLPCSCSQHTDSHVCGGGGTGHRVHSHSNRAPEIRWSLLGSWPAHSPCEGRARRRLVAALCWPFYHQGCQQAYVHKKSRIKPHRPQQPCSRHPPSLWPGLLWLGTCREEDLILLTHGRQ